MFPRFLSISLGCFALGAFIAQGASAQTCGTGTCTSEQFCYVGDGDLVDPGVPCIIFQGSGLMIATLSNYGGFSAGDQVHVEGCAGLIISSCQVAPFHISNNTIESSFPEPDFDDDGIGDALDNCSERSNPAQVDTDLDDCGNVCDADYDQNGIVTIGDFGAFVQAFGTTNNLYQHTPPINPTTSVSIGDFGFYGQNFGSVPGPSGLTAGTTACP